MSQESKVTSVVAIFTDRAMAAEARAALIRDGVAEDRISSIARQSEEDDDGTEALAELDTSVAKGAATGGAVGGAAGAAVGALAGALAFAIPGIGPGVGFGIWASTLGSAAAGATMGGMIGAFQKMWDERYHEAVDKGATLVGVEIGDGDDAAQAVEVLRPLNPDSLDQLDQGGELVHQH